MHEYRGRLPLLHFDAWMEGRERSFLADGGAEGLGGEAVAVIEWGERVADGLPRPYLRVRLGHGPPRDGRETRTIELGIVGAGGGLEALLGAGAPSAELEHLPRPLLDEPDAPNP
jgi:tRNA A37 threonylcarbamoyladenosine biosynthesis protein TsaE